MDFALLNSHLMRRGKPIENKSVLIWCHGAGDTLENNTYISRLFPEVPCIILQGSFPVGGGYRFFTQVSGDTVKDDEIDYSVEELMQLIDTLGLYGSKLVLAGFSNGGSFASYFALKARDFVGNVFDFAGYIPRTEWYINFIANKKNLDENDLFPRLHWFHSSEDNVNEFSYAMEGVKDVGDIRGLRLRFVNYKGGHTIPQKGIEMIGSVL